MDNTPGVTCFGEVQTDFGGYGLLTDSSASVYGPGTWAPAHLDPTQDSAARVNYAGSFGGQRPPIVESFASKRVRFSDNPELMNRQGRLMKNLAVQEAAMDSIVYGQGVEDAGVTHATDPFGQQYVGYGRSGFSGGREGADGDGGLLGGLLSDRDLQVLVFIMLVYLVLQSMIAGAVATACARPAAREEKAAPAD
jgi:hypothetical protein